MALHEQSIGKTNEWYTPPHVFAALGCRFDMDVATPPGGAPWVPAATFISKAMDGLATPWTGFVWMNPPFGGRNGLEPWLAKFMAHGNGVALVPDRTSAPWWQSYAPRADLMLFVAPKLKFIGADGRPGASPAQGTTLFACGQGGGIGFGRRRRSRLRAPGHSAEGRSMNLPRAAEAEALQPTLFDLLDAEAQAA